MIIFRHSQQERILIMKRFWEDLQAIKKQIDYQYLQQKILAEKRTAREKLILRMKKKRSIPLEIME